MRNSFILYSSYEEVLKELPKEEIGELLMAIFVYQRTGEKLELSGGANIAFGFIKNQLDIDAEKWAKEVENRSKAGRKGMEKRWGITSSKYARILEKGGKLFLIKKFKQFNPVF